MTEAKTCLRCGQSIRRKVMATAKYCSAECRQRCAKEAYEKRQKRPLHALGKLGMIAAHTCECIDTGCAGCLPKLILSG